MEENKGMEEKKGSVRVVVFDLLISKEKENLLLSWIIEEGVAEMQHEWSLECPQLCVEKATGSKRCRITCTFVAPEDGSISEKKVTQYMAKNLDIEVSDFRVAQRYSINPAVHQNDGESSQMPRIDSNDTEDSPSRRRVHAHSRERNVFSLDMDDDGLSSSSVRTRTSKRSRSANRSPKKKSMRSHGSKTPNFHFESMDTQNSNGTMNLVISALAQPSPALQNSASVPPPPKQPRERKLTRGGSTPSVLSAPEGRQELKPKKRRQRMHYPLVQPAPSFDRHGATSTSPKHNLGHEMESSSPNTENKVLMTDFRTKLDWKAKAIRYKQEMAEIRQALSDQESRSLEQINELKLKLMENDRRLQALLLCTDTYSTMMGPLMKRNRFKRFELRWARFDHSGLMYSKIEMSIRELAQDDIELRNIKDDVQFIPIKNIIAVKRSNKKVNHFSIEVSTLSQRNGTFRSCSTESKSGKVVPVKEYFFKTNQRDDPYGDKATRWVNLVESHLKQLDQLEWQEAPRSVTPHNSPRELAQILPKQRLSDSKNSHNSSSRRFNTTPRQRNWNRGDRISRSSSTPPTTRRASMNPGWIISPPNHNKIPTIASTSLVQILSAAVGSHTASDGALDSQSAHRGGSNGKLHTFSASRLNMQRSTISSAVQGPSRLSATSKARSSWQSEDSDQSFVTLDSTDVQHQEVKRPQSTQLHSPKSTTSLTLPNLNQFSSDVTSEGDVSPRGDATSPEKEDVKDRFRGDSRENFESVQELRNKSLTFLKKTRFGRWESRATLIHKHKLYYSKNRGHIDMLLCAVQAAASTALTEEEMFRAAKVQLDAVSVVHLSQVTKLNCYKGQNGKKTYINLTLTTWKGSEKILRFQHPDGDKECLDWINVLRLHRIAFLAKSPSKKILLSNEETKKYLVPLDIQTCTWNVNHRKPPENLDEWLSPDNRKPHIYCIALQEVVKLTTKSVATDIDQSFTWRRHIEKCLLPRGYNKVISQHLVGLLLVIYAQHSILPHICDVSTKTIAAGVMGVAGNKGAVAIDFRIFNSKIALVNCHLAAHKAQVKQRNQTLSRISKKLQLDGYQNDAVILMGDLNYRLGINDKSIVEQIIQRKHWPLLLANDQLHQERSKGTILKDYHEAPITFAPTFKFEVGTNSYENKKGRIPSWCDRILWKCSRSGGNEAITCNWYRSSPKYTISDHKPVAALLTMSVIAQHTNLDIQGCALVKQLILDSKMRSTATRPEEKKAKKGHLRKRSMSVNAAIFARFSRNTEIYGYGEGRILHQQGQLRNRRASAIDQKRKTSYHHPFSEAK
mmetsp:Transcript_9666/g.14479  ORF Transcript_9666/g.14479 Transcript_9666/m.14479 type:complete len:1303 (+) Transcript_9666:115-4023(+)